MAYQGGCGSLDASGVEPVGQSAGESSSRAPNSGGVMAEKEEEQLAGDRHPAGTYPLQCRISKLINWKRPLWTSALFGTTNIVFWFVSLSPCRVFSLVSMCLAVLVVTQLVRDVALSRSRGAALWRRMTSSWEVIDSVQEGKSGSVSPFTDFWTSFKLFIEETSSFKQQNPGKFCLLVCSMCSFLAILGRYIPGVVISYIFVLGIFLWPLVSSHEFGMWLEPVLQKLDFGVGEFLQRIKENHEKRILQSQAERASIESDLSALFPKLDSTVCKELSVSDTEVSEVTWTDNGTFNLSEGNTPQTENSEDSDRRSDEEVFTGGLPEFPSLDNGLGTNGEDDEDLSIGLPTPLAHPSRIGSKQLEEEPVVQALEVVERLAGEVIMAAVTAAMQERLEATVAPALVQALAEESESEAEDFELLDQSELEQLEGELGLDKANRADPSKPKLLKLLQRVLIKKSSMCSFANPWHSSCQFVQKRCGCLVRHFSRTLQSS
ncbi:reticulophagy regulator 1-like isoform X2 [Myxocyprinus asiaticus]|uniref:reticulophagy regulator 1-like isoform X2 n=1 Tax=Myxocyprinus asiaticus TaxID=70543 RepID=UPI0022213C48|nr:reticulophagy regulator 1-like isoform X2 [Myxocyprinus asiaticus]